MATSFGKRWDRHSGKCHQGGELTQDVCNTCRYLKQGRAPIYERSDIIPLWVYRGRFAKTDDGLIKGGEDLSPTGTKRHGAPIRVDSESIPEVATAKSLAKVEGDVLQANTRLAGLEGSKRTDRWIIVLLGLMLAAQAFPDYAQRLGPAISFLRGLIFAQ